MCHLIRLPSTLLRLLAVFAVSGAVLALTGAVSAAEPAQGIHVNGVGEVQVVPDMARVSLEVRREGEDAAALKEELDTVTAAVIELTRTLDIESRDVTAAQVSVYPRYRRPDDEQPPPGVVATRSIDVTVRDLEHIAGLINGALERGANGVTGMVLDASNRPELERKALDLAIDDATREAQQMAKRFEVNLGKLLDATSTPHSAQPLRFAGMAEARVADKSFEPGELTIRRDVQATFGIRP